MKERILLHLFEYVRHRDALEVPSEMTQEGISQASRIDVPHFTQYTRPLIQEGLVRERMAHVRGSRRRRKVYDLTEAGQQRVVGLREKIRDEVVRIRDPSGVRTMAVGQVLREAAGRIPLLEVLHQATETGFVDLSPPVAPPSVFVEMLADAPALGKFVGRQEQLEAVTRDGDRPRIFIVRGVAGIGKSTFAAKACELLRGQRNLFWRRVRAWDTMQSMLASLGDFLSALGRPGLKSVLVRGEVAKAAEVLRNDLPGTRSFIVFDDAHEATAETQPFLRLLKEAIAGASDVRALILAREALPFYDRRDVALDSLVHEMDLAGLRPGETAALFSGQGEAAAFLKATRALGGHPLLLELARSHHETDSHRLREVGRFVEEEVYQKLSASERKVMKTASLYRMPVPREAFFSDRGLSYEVLLSLKDRSLIRPVGDENFEVHDTIRSAFLSFLTESEQAELGGFAVRRLREFASKARELRNLVAAIDYLSNALNISASKEDRATILEELGDVSERTGDLSAALTAYKEALKACDEREVLARLHRKAASALTARGQMQSASEEARTALELLGETFGVERGSVDLVRCRIAAGLNEWEEACDLGEASSRVFEAMGHLPGYARALLELAYIRMHSPRSDVSRAERDLMKALDLVGRINDLEFAAKVHTALIHFSMYHIPDVERAFKHLTASEAVIGAGADPQARLDFLIMKGLFETDFLEDYKSAETDLMEAIGLARKTYAADAMAAAQYTLALTRFYRGYFDLAKKEFIQLTADMSEVGLMESEPGKWGTNFLHWLLMTELCCLLEEDLEELKRTAAKVDDPRLSRSLVVRKEEATMLRGINELQKGNRDGSLAAFQQAVQEADTRFVPVLMFLSLFLYGVALRAVGQDREAAEHLQRARDLLLSGGLRAWMSVLDDMELRTTATFRRLLDSQ